MNTKRLATNLASVTLAATMLSTSLFASAVEFTDVPRDHWAHAAITEMADRGIVTGMGNSTYAPESKVNCAQFATMLMRSFYPDKIGSGGETWYTPFMTAAKQVGALEGVAASAETPITRYDMAQMMYNILTDKSAAPSDNFDTSIIADWTSVPTSYQKAVSACYSLGTLSGVDQKGTFSGTGVMTRAQAATVMDRMLDICKTPTPTPTTPASIPANAKKVTSIEETRAWDGVSVDNGIFKVDGTGLLGGPAFLSFDNDSYTNVSFTVSATTSDDVQVMFSHLRKDAKYGESGTTDILGVVKAGTSQTFSVSISNDKRIGFGLGNMTRFVELFPEDVGATGPRGHAGIFVECEVSNLYFW